MPCKNHITIEQTVNLFFQHVWVHFGLPTSIVLDRDTRFLGDFWTILGRMMDTKLKRRIAFHPWTCGQTKQWYFFFKATEESILSYGMNIYPMYNMLIIYIYIHPLKFHLWDMFWVPTKGSFGLNVSERCRCEWRTNRGQSLQVHPKDSADTLGSQRIVGEESSTI